jgi:hypothetical protein
LVSKPFSTESVVDFLYLEVDGSLANPYVAGAVAIWTVLATIGAIVVVRTTGSGATLSRLGYFSAMLLFTVPAQFFIGNVLYRVVDPQITSVGFWGGPPVWIAPTVSGCVGGVAWFREYRRRTV